MKLWQRMVAASAFMAGGLMAQAAVAAPISYEGMLESGVVTYGQVAPQPRGGGPLLTDGDWWSFYAEAGDEITLTLHRREVALDPTMNFYFGYGDTDDLFYLTQVDDNISPLPGFGGGPYWDAELRYTIGTTGYYSVFVFSWASGHPGADGVFDYQIELRGATGLPPVSEVPEPAALGLLGLGLLGAGALRRRRK